MAITGHLAEKGILLHNSKQWELYRDHLSMLTGLHPVALKTDIVSFFASIPLATIQDEVDGRTPSNHVSRRLLTLLEGFGSTPHRSGLPQRSTASAVIANMILIALDDVLEHHSRPLSKIFGRGIQYHSFARWMDDMWLFVRDPGYARRAQVELQHAAQMAGLNLNAAKTDVLEDGAAVEEVREIEHSAVDLALLVGKSDHGPLEKLIDKIIEFPEKTGRTSIKFASVRMREYNCRHRARELIHAAKRMPHAADSLAPLFKTIFTTESLQDWFLDYANGDWAAFGWSIAQYARMFDSSTAPKKSTLEYFEKLIENPGTSLPLLSVSSQRLADWKPTTARAVIRAAMRSAGSAHARRVLALSALNAGDPRRVVKSWLDGHDGNRVTLEMLESRRFRPLNVVESYRR